MSFIKHLKNLNQKMSKYRFYVEVKRMITPPVIQGLTNENTMLSSASIEDLEEYKKNACKILRSQTQCATAKIVEELIDQEIMNRKIIEKWYKIYEQFPEHVGM